MDKLSIKERLELLSMPEPNSGCILWCGTINHHGYGVLSIGETKYTAHRVAYTALVGPIPDGLPVCHKCGVLACVNPDHLFLGARPDDNTRFWAKVDKSGGPMACWLWTASIKGGGYGGIRIGKQVVSAHRYAYEVLNGPIPDGLCVLHNCPTGDNPACVNPAHLWLGTQVDNIADCKAKGRNSCPRGEAQPMAKLDDAKIKVLRADYANGVGTLEELGARYGVTKSLVHKIVHRLLWGHVP